MDVGILELNDAGIRLTLGEKQSEISPGYASVDGDKLLLGNAAMQQARLNPLQSNNQFWHRLSAEPLPVHNERYRHHADLAYSQLLAVHRDIAECENLIFALPGNYTREQMALLLGIVDQCPFKAVGLADSAVAASSIYAPSGPCLHIDAQLHQSVFTLLSVDGSVTRQKIEVLPSAGLLTLRDRFAKSIADQFVDQSRFDPLHSAVTEQSIYDQLPHWLAQSFDQADMIMEVAGKTAKISRNQLVAPLNDYFQQIGQLAMDLLGGGNGQLLVGHSLACLPGFLECLTSMTESTLRSTPIPLPENAVAAGIQHNINSITKLEGELAFVQSLPAHSLATTPSTSASNNAASQPSASITSNGRRASHILVGNRAFPLGSAPLFISIDNGIHLSPTATKDSVGIIQGLDNDISLLPQGKVTLYCNKQAVNDNLSVQTGDCINADNIVGQLQFIEVDNSGP